MMKTIGIPGAVILCATAVFGVTQAQDVFVYPANGQNAEQQSKDEYACYQWASQNTGYDPSRPQGSGAPAPAQEEQVGGVGRGAVRGGLGGLAIGAIAGDAGKGAAIGAASGALIGGVRRHDQNSRQQQQQAQHQQQQAAAQNQGRSNYNRAYSACLEGRGYTVK